jgi:hypothetical protein
MISTQRQQCYHVKHLSNRRGIGCSFNPLIFQNKNKGIFTI